MVALESAGQKSRIIHKEQGEGRGGEGAGGVGVHVEKRSVLEKVTLPAPDVLLPWLQPKKVNERKAH